MMFQCIKAGREHQLGPSVDTRTCVSLRYMYVLFSAVLHVAVALRTISGHFDQENIVLTSGRLGLS